MYNHASCTLTINGIFPLILNTLVGNFVMILLYKYPPQLFSDMHCPKPNTNGAKKAFCKRTQNGS